MSQKVNPFIKTHSADDITVEEAERAVHDFLRDDTDVELWYVRAYADGSMAIAVQPRSWLRRFAWYRRRVWIRLFYEVDVHVRYTLAHSFRMQVAAFAEMPRDIPADAPWAPL